MKRTNLLSHLVIAFSLATYAHAQVGTVRDPAVEKAAQEYRRHEETLSKFQKDVGKNSTDDQQADADQRRKELRLLVKKSFYARQQLRAAQLRSLQRRLRDIERANLKSQANEEAVIDARVDALLAGAPVSGDEVASDQTYIYDDQVKTVRRRVSGGGETVTVLSGSEEPSAGLRFQTVVPLHSVPVPVPAPIAPTSQLVDLSPEDRTADDFDLETRERLAEIDVEAATANRDAAKADYEAHKQANEKARGSTPKPEMQKLAATLRIAEIEVKRAKTTLEGLARLRSQTGAAPSVTYQTHAERPAVNADIDTRERLAQIDLEEATAQGDAAVKELDYYTKSPGAIPVNQFRKAKAAVPLAEIEVKRAKAKLEGIARERAELIDSIEAEVEEAEATRHKAEAKLRASFALAGAADAEIVRAEADLANAQTNLDFQQKQYKSVTQLHQQGGAAERQVREAAKELENAKGASESLRAGLVIAKTKALQAKSAVAESQADLELAEVRVRAAKARRDRLAGPPKTSPTAPQPKPATDAKQ